MFLFLVVHVLDDVFLFIANVWSLLRTVILFLVII